MSDHLNQFFMSKSPIISIRSKYYVGVLLCRLGVERVAHIPKALKERNGAAECFNYAKYRSDLFRYNRGENIRNPEFVRNIDELLPGTARILNHPIWPLLSIPTMQESELLSLARGIEPNLQRYILKHDEITRAMRFKNLSRDRHWLKRGSSFRQMIDRCGLDELAVLLIAIRTHEIQGNYRVSFFLRDMISEFFTKISQISEFQPVVIPLYRQVHELFIGSVYKHPHKQGVMLDYIQGISSASLDRMLIIIEGLSSIDLTRRRQCERTLKVNRRIAN
ncbi:hypothetical protein [Metapseudomonas otitidis]|uniref:hypothetical protein n=1 Tax=Metapseudomonas otitidis TaxID=319939 RepID=UPI0013F5E485|nr:hypothetical protein [Pseudomonas otitidis]